MCSQHTVFKTPFTLFSILRPWTCLEALWTLSRFVPWHLSTSYCFLNGPPGDYSGMGDPELRDGLLISLGWIFCISVFIIVFRRVGGCMDRWMDDGWMDRLIDWLIDYRTKVKSCLQDNQDKNPTRRAVLSLVGLGPFAGSVAVHRVSSDILPIDFFMLCFRTFKTKVAKEWLVGGHCINGSQY